MTENKVERNQRCVSKIRKVIKVIGITVCVLCVVAFVVMSYIIGVQVADGLVYQNKGNDTKANSKKQLNEWGYNIQEFDKKHIKTIRLYWI